MKILEAVKWTDFFILNTSIDQGGKPMVRMALVVPFSLNFIVMEFRKFLKALCSDPIYVIILKYDISDCNLLPHF